MYGEFKQLLLEELRMKPESLHFALGMLGYAMCFAVTRRPWLSLWLVVGVQVGNELLDAREDLRGGIWNPQEAVIDTAWTIALPSAAAGCFAAVQAVVQALPR